MSSVVDSWAESEEEWLPGVHYRTVLLFSALLPFVGRAIVDYLLPQACRKNGVRAGDTAATSALPLLATKEDLDKAYTVGEWLWVRHPSSQWWECLEVRRIAQDGGPRFNEYWESTESKLDVASILPVVPGQNVWVSRLDCADPWTKAQVAAVGAETKQAGVVHVRLGGFGDDVSPRRLEKYAMVSTELTPSPRPFTMELALQVVFATTRANLRIVGGWAAMLAHTQQSHCSALGKALLRLSFWHVAQPVAYFVVLAVNASYIDGLQLWLGLAVGIREVIYLVATLLAAVVHPAFLAIDVAATVRLLPNVRGNYYGRGLPFFALYVASPDKFVVTVLALALLKRGTRIPFIFGVFSGIFDLCGVAALSAGFASGVMPPELAIGYMVTTLSALGLLVSFLAGYVKMLLDHLSDPKRSKKEKVLGICCVLYLSFVVLSLPIAIAGWPVLIKLTSGSTAAIVELGLLSALGGSVVWLYGSGSKPASLEKHLSVAFAILTVLVLVVLVALVTLRDDGEGPLSLYMCICPVVSVILTTRTIYVWLCASRVSECAEVQSSDAAIEYGV